MESKPTISTDIGTADGTVVGVDKGYAEGFKAVMNFLENIDRRLTNIDTRLTNLETKVTELDKNIDTRLTNLETKVTKLDTKVTTLDTKVTTLDKRFQSNEHNFRKAGTTYEILALNYIRDKRGSNYCRSFKVDHLFGLTRVALPKNVCWSDPTETNPTGTFITVPETNSYFNDGCNVNKLLLLAKNNLPGLQEYYDEFVTTENNSKIKSNKMNLLGKELKSYELKSNAIDQDSYLRENKLGLFAFTTWKAADNQIHFVSQLEFDVRGEVRIFNDNSIEIYVGEIKSGEGYNEALTQIIKRLWVVQKAAICLTRPDLRVWMRGEIYTNTKEWLTLPRDRAYLIEIMETMKLPREDIETIFPANQQSFLTITVELIGLH